jgi:homoserine dehydrogenase
MSIINEPPAGRTTQHIGLFGFGVVGKGLYDVLKNTPGLQASIKKVCIKNPGKKRSAADLSFTTDAAALLEDDSINVIVELIDDAAAAYHIVKSALQKGKAVVTANKKMIAAHFEELYFLQKKHKTALLYEAACCGSIPIIRNLEEYYDNDMLHCVRGIINGSTNYILTKISEGRLSFAEALLEAQQLGFAESDPSLDVEGQDALNKLIILIAHSFGLAVRPHEILFSGISAIRMEDAAFAKEKNFRIKLVAHASKSANGKLAAFVLPAFIAANDDLYHVQNEFNGLVTESSFADKHTFKGKGAGAFPTAAAVLSDLSALGYGYRYEYKKLGQANDIQLKNDHYLKVFVSAPGIKDIPQQAFEWIEEWHNEYNYAWVTGVIQAKELLRSAWWKQPGISLILCNGPVIENIAYRSVQKRSLELAGI